PFYRIREPPAGMARRGECVGPASRGEISPRSRLERCDGRYHGRCEIVVGLDVPAATSTTAPAGARVTAESDVGSRDRGKSVAAIAAGASDQDSAGPTGRSHDRDCEAGIPAIRTLRRPRRPTPTTAAPVRDQDGSCDRRDGRAKQDDRAARTTTTAAIRCIATPATGTRRIDLAQDRDLSGGEEIYGASAGTAIGRRTAISWLP
ncbi:MAG TPA: hypothetical protein VF469_05275, partial [Kofleriaceae bacterium]